VVVELQELLLARERELDSREGVVVAQEDGMLTFKCPWGGSAKDVMSSVLGLRLSSMIT
jgi:hypothetical protein